MPQYIVVCEGYSERAYLKRLQSFLDKMAPEWPVPLQFIPIMAKNPDGTDKGGGNYSNVTSCFRQQRKGNKKASIEIWVDHDIYFRQTSAPERRNRESYLKKPAGIPDFRFSIHNFEDFLVLHMEDSAVQRWHAAFDPAGHVATPLHSKAYMPLYAPVLPGYRKGDLSSDVITKESLLRLKGNLAKPLIPAPADPSFRSFAHFLIDNIDAAFPTLLVPPPAIPPVSC